MVEVDCEDDETVYAITSASICTRTAKAVTYSYEEEEVQALIVFEGNNNNKR